MDWDKSYTITTSTTKSNGAEFLCLSNYTYSYSTVIIPENGYILWQNTAKSCYNYETGGGSKKYASCSFYINGKGFAVNTPPYIDDESVRSHTDTFSILVKKDDVIQARGHGSVVFIPFKK